MAGLDHVDVTHSCGASEEEAEEMLNSVAQLRVAASHTEAPLEQEAEEMLNSDMAQSLTEPPLEQEAEEMLAQLSVSASHTEAPLKHAEEIAPIKHIEEISELNNNEAQSHFSASHDKHAEEMREVIYSDPQSHATASPSEAQSPNKHSEAPNSDSTEKVQEIGEMLELDNSKSEIHVITSHTEAPIKHGGGPLLDCVVKIFCMHTKPNYSQPWQMKHQYSSSSSGFIISGRRLLTTAHSVRHHTQVKVKKRGSDTQFLATVLATGRDCDLALLTVNSDEFWEGLDAFVEFGDLPSLQDAVTVVGYPVGGDSMSVTRGVVSRVEVTPYVDGTRLLGVQIDAAINAGNSGGPAFNDKAQCVGVAFQKLSRGCDNIGYIVPTPVITHFITDYERNGEYTGFPSLAISWQRLQNPDLRKAFGMAPHLKGVRIIKVAPTSPSAMFLQTSDIFLSFDGVNIGNDGTVPFRNGEMIHYSYLVSAKYTGEQARIGILRDSVVHSFDIKLQSPKRLIPKYTAPSYYITGGIVFTIVSEPYLLSEFGKDFRHAAPPSLMDKFSNSMAQTEDEELVIISQILAAEINFDYEKYSNHQVVSFNGTLIINLKQFMHLVETCEEPFLRFELEHHHVLVLDTKKAKRATPKILRTHRIPSAMSEDLMEAKESSEETEAS